MQGANTNDLSKYYSKFDIGIAIAADLKINRYFSLEARYDYGLKNIANTTIIDYSGNLLDRVVEGNNRIIAIGISYYFIRGER